MTRNLFILAGLLLMLVVGGFLVGLGGAPAGAMISLICAAPLFLFTLGAAIGRASNEFTIERKTKSNTAAPTTTINSRLHRVERERL